MLIIVKQFTFYLHRQYTARPYSHIGTSKATHKAGSPPEGDRNRILLHMKLSITLSLLKHRTFVVWCHW